MYLAIQLSDFNSRYLYLQNRVPNTIIDNSWYRKLLYSNKDYNINGLYLYVPLTVYHIDYSFNKIRYRYNISVNADLLKKLYLIEETIINSVYKDKKYIPVLKLRDQLLTGSINLYTPFNTSRWGHGMIVKIAGLWETGNFCGITFKFIATSPSHQSKSILK